VSPNRNACSEPARVLIQVVWNFKVTVKVRQSYNAESERGGGFHYSSIGKVKSLLEVIVSEIILEVL